MVVEVVIVVVVSNNITSISIVTSGIASTLIKTPPPVVIDDVATIFALSVIFAGTSPEQGVGKIDFFKKQNFLQRI